MFAKETKILIVDDMSIMRKLVRKYLTEMGFTNLTEASNGAEGWTEMEKAIAAGTPFQLIVSDWNMPVMTGQDFLKKIRTTDKTKGLPFVLLTAESEAGQVASMVALGVNAYITKPFTVETLTEKLGAVYQGWAKKAA